MAVEPRTGGDSFIIAVFQDRYGGHPTDFQKQNVGDAVSITLSVGLGTTTAKNIAADANKGAGRFTFTADTGAIGQVTVAGEAADGTPITELITWEAANAPRAMTTAKRFSREAAVTVTPNAAYPGKTGTITGATYQQQNATYVLPNRVPFTRNTLDGDGDQAQSASIVGGGSDTLNTPGLLGASGELEFEVLPEAIIPLAVSLLNPNAPPISTALENVEIRSGAYTLDEELITAALKTATPPKHIAGNWPGKLKATITGTGLGGTPKMAVTGFRKVGLPGDEKFPVLKNITPPAGSIAATEITIVSESFFTEIDSVKITGVTGTITDVSLAFVPETYRTEVRLNTQNRQFPGLSFQMSKGGMPVIANDFVPSSGQIRISDAIRFLLTGTASQVVNRRMLTAPNTEALVYDGTADGGAAALANFPVMALDFYPAWGGAFYFDTDTEPTEFTDLTLGVNHNYEPSRGYKGSRRRGRPVVADGAVRQVTLNWTGHFASGDAATDQFHRWEDYYRDNYTAKVFLNLYNWLSTGRQYRVECEGAQFQLTEFPTVPIESAGQIPRNLTGKIVPSPGATADEIIFRVWGPKSYDQLLNP